MKKHRFLLILMVFAGVATALTSCDSNSVPIRPTELTFDGVTYGVLGQAELEVTNEGLVVANIGSSGNDGVRVDPDSSIEEADIRTLPVILPENGRWGMQVFGETSASGRTALATVWNEAVSAEEHDLLFDFAPELNVADMEVTFYLDGLVVHSVVIPVNGGGNRSRTATAGRGRGGPTSIHVICVNGELIVATDHGGEPPRTTPEGCGAELFTNVPGTDFDVCADFVQARPISKVAFPDANSLEITGRSISQFVVTDGFVVQP